MRSDSALLLLGLADAALSTASVQARDTPAVLAMPFVYERDTSLRLSRRSNTLDVDAGGEIVPGIFPAMRTFAANFTYGTPPQHFQAYLETVTNGCWLVTARGSCSDSDCADEWGSYNITNSTSATELDEPFDTWFSTLGSEHLNGSFVTDNLTIGGATLKDMKMGLFDPSQYGDNTLGLGYGNESSVSLTQSLADAGVINSPSFSIYDNTVLFGGVNKAKYNGSLETFPIVNSSTSSLDRALRLNMEDIYFDGKSISSDKLFPLDAIFDVQVPYTYIPVSVAEALSKKIETASEPNYGGLLNFSCNALHNDSKISFKFGDTGFEFDLEEFIVYDEMDETCFLKIASYNGTIDEGKIILGADFINKTYAVFDLENDEISLAKRTWTDAEDDIVEIKSGKNGVPGTKDHDSAGTRVGMSVGVTTLLVVSAMFAMAI
ncbi:hypothetical protein N7456_007954 [Penicillium angulare]|uniref:Peptidase A1 domain-containing protein n=1 Tax=Penicillium angulare TaxID=116970 RepID=A0A9W9FBM0_9EURO|nr:hypothetical protein N7456_007954 [Penicillium angulare]